VAPEARLEDVLPTVLVALGVGLPQELDGQPLLDIFQQAPQVSRTEASPGLARPHRDVYTDEEEQELRRRLEGLGYL
jgi:arylsulfatase A-like enzyme